MPETDLNNVGTVDQQDLNNADVVNQQDLNNDGSVDQQKQDDKLADGTDPNKEVKYADLKKATDRAAAEATARKEAEEKAAYAQRQLELMQQQALVNANPPQQQQPLTSMEQALIDCGVKADELFGEDYVKVTNRKDQIDAQKTQQQQQTYSIQQFVATHPDINQVIGSVNPVTGQIMSMSSDLMALLAKKPEYAGASLQIAYDAVKQEQELAKLAKTQASLDEHQNRQGVDNATQPQGGSAAGGSGAGEQANPKLMSKQEVDATQARIDSGDIQ